MQDSVEFEVTDKRKDEMPSDRVERIRKLRSITGLNLHETMRLDERILQEGIYTRASSPPVPDDVAEAVKVLNMLDGHDLWVETLEYPEDGREGYRSTCPVRKEAFKAAKETLIRAASTPSAEVETVTEVTVEELAEIMSIQVCDSYTEDMEFLAERFPYGFKIKAAED